MAREAGFEPAYHESESCFLETAFLPIRILPKNIWCAIRDLNSEILVPKTSAYANSANRANGSGYSC